MSKFKQSVVRREPTTNYVAINAALACGHYRRYRLGPGKNGPQIGEVVVCLVCRRKDAEKGGRK